MTTLLALLFVFGIIHINPAMPKWKAHAVASFGKAYGPIYGILTLALFAAVIWAFRQAEPGFVYDPPTWGRYANFALTLVGFIFIGMFLFRGSWRNAVKYPMAIGISLWAFGHLLANGDQRSVVLFSGMAVIAIAFAFLKNLNGLFVPSDVRQGHNIISVLGGIALYGIAAQLHYVIAGVHLVTLK
jgi:uncharacterized membrane protein